MLIGTSSNRNSLSVTGTATLGSSLGVSGDFKVATDKFTVDSNLGNVGIAGNLAVTSATTLTGALTLTGAAALGNDITMSKTDATLTHTPASGGLTLKSTYGYVAVEDVRFTGNTSGISTDADIISLTNATVVVDGALSASGDFSIATTAFAVASSSGDTSVGGTLGVTGAATLQDALTVSGATTVSNTLTVTQGASLQSTLNVGGTFTVATTKFTVDSGTGNTVVGGTLGVTSAATLSSTLSVTSDATLMNSLLMSKAAAAITHSASSGGLTISSTNGYVNVEDVRFTGTTIGTSGDTDLISLADGHATITGKLTANDDFSVATTGKFTVAAATGATAVGGTLAVTDATVQLLPRTKYHIEPQGEASLKGKGEMHLSFVDRL